MDAVASSRWIGCCTLLVVEEDPQHTHFYVKCFECREKHYTVCINVTN